MVAPARPALEPGRVYRTRELARWGANAPRLAKRLVAEGALVPLAHGLFAHPRVGRFRVVPPSDEALMTAFLDGTPFVFTGPERWNALGLGTTAAFVDRLVYNTKRSGRFVLGGRGFVLRRVAFPEPAPPEWFVIDLLEHAAQVGASRADLGEALVRAVADGHFRREVLQTMADRYGTAATRRVVDVATRKAA